MHSTQEVIAAFLELPPKQQEEVRDFVISNRDEAADLIKAFDADYVREEDYSPEDMAVIQHGAEEAKRGINVSPALKGKAAIDYLTEFESQAQI